MTKRDLTHAKDDRSEAEFETCMFKSDRKEEIWADIICNEMIFKSGKKITYENYGCGHDGKVIMKAEDVNSKPDKKFFIDGQELLIEIKAYDKSNGNPREMVTIKLHSLKSCIKYNACIIVPSLHSWALFPPASLEYIIEKGKPKIYNGFSPNDLAIRLYAMEISIMLADKIMKIYDWEDWESKNKIEKNWKKLFIKDKDERKT